MRSIAISTGSLLLLAGAVSGQSVRVTVRVDGTRQPVAGAIVKLIDSVGSVLQSGLTNDGGRVVLAGRRGGSYRVRADRIGFRGLTSGLVIVPDTGAIALELLMPDQPVVLSEISVRGTTRCGGDPATRVETADLWSEIRKALDAAVISKRSGLTFRMATWERYLDTTLAITRQRVDTIETNAPRPFSAISGELLAERGYVIPDPNGGAVLYGPDEETLLSDHFLRSHCFGLRGKTENGKRLIGLRFEPAPNRRLPDVAGTLWVDPITRELRYVEFGYRNVPPAMSQEGMSGRVEFSRLLEGWWIVERWYIRAPLVLELRVLSTLILPQDVRTRRVVDGYREHGGAIVQVKGPPRIQLARAGGPGTEARSAP